MRALFVSAKAIRCQRHWCSFVCFPMEAYSRAVVLFPMKTTLPLRADELQQVMGKP